MKNASRAPDGAPIFHHKDVLDLQCSPHRNFLISDLVDHSCIIWDATRGRANSMLTASEW